VPDIAADSGGGVPGALSSGYNFTDDMLDGPEGGTSLSAPLADGMWTRIQAAAPARGLGFADESLYRLATGPHYHRDFYDITAAETPAGNFTSRPGPGWDYTSGLGVMDVAHLMQDLDHRLTPSNPVGPPAVPPNPLGGACRAVYTSPQGNATDPYTGQNDPAFDFTSGRLALSADRTSLIVTMSGPGLSPVGPPTLSGGGAYTVFWTYKGRTYFAQAYEGPLTDSFFDGHVDHDQGLVDDHFPTGSFTPGQLEITVPLADVGNPPVGARLQYPYGLVVAYAVGAPGIVGAIGVPMDAGSNDDYVVGYHC
jgi:hypothetical protein